jgi:hypothetical protein
MKFNINILIINISSINLLYFYDDINFENEIVYFYMIELLLLLLRKINLSLIILNDMFEQKRTS